MNTKMLTTGAFAELCGAKKGTLLFYDKEGLLKPKCISENGYRHYRIDQYFEFELISILKSIGSPLKDIKKYLHNMDGENFLNFLEERYNTVKKELDAMKIRKDMLYDMVTCLNESLQFNYDVLMIQHHDEESFEIIDTGAKPSESQEENIQRFIKYNEYIVNQEEQPRYPFGVILNFKDVKQGKYIEKYYFNKKRKCTKHSNLHIKHDGMYAVMGHKGTDETHKKALQNMISQIESLGMTIKSDIYVYDMMSYISRDDGDVYAQKYCIGV